MLVLSIILGYFLVGIILAAAMKVYEEVNPLPITFEDIVLGRDDVGFYTSIVLFWPIILILAACYAAFIGIYHLIKKIILK